MAGNKRPSAKTSKAASKVLRDGRTGDDSKTAAGYALGDTPAKQSGAKKAGAKKAGAKKGTTKKSAS